MKKALAVLIVVGLAVAGVMWWRSRATRQEPQASEAGPKEVSVTRGSLRATVEATGRVVPEQEVEIKCKASGEVVKLPVDVSDRVEKGDLLVQLDPEDEEQNVKRAEVDLAVSEARLAQARLALQIAEWDLKSERLRAKAALQSAQVKAEDAAARLKRVEQLREKKIASEEELDAACATEAQADATLKDAQARIEDLKTKEVQLASRRHDITIAEQQVEAIRISLADAKRRLADTTVPAPIAGVVATRNVQVGQIIASGVSNVGGGTSVLTLADLSRIYVLVSVDESDIGRVRVGQPAAITVDAYPDRRLRGEVVRVATKGEVTSNVVTFEVKVEVTSRQKHVLKPEMTANVAVVTVDKADTLLLPVAAVQRRGPRSVVRVANASGEPEMRPVTVGESDGERIEILEGVEEGDRVILPDKAGAGRWRQEDDGNAARNERRSERMRGRMMGGGRGR